MAFIYYKWEEVNINWEALDLNWEEVGYLEQVGKHFGFPPIPGEKPKMDLKKINELPEETKRGIIKIIAKLEGLEITQYKYKKDGSIKVTAKDIEKLVEHLQKNIKVNVQNIS